MSNESTGSLRKLLNKLKKRTDFVFEEKCENGLFTINFQLLDHICENLGSFKTVKFLNISPYEYSHFILKRVHLKKSVRRVTRIRETFCAQ